MITGTRIGSIYASTKFMNGNPQDVDRLILVSFGVEKKSNLIILLCNILKLMIFPYNDKLIMHKPTISYGQLLLGAYVNFLPLAPPQTFN